LTFGSGARAAGQYLMELQSRGISKTVPIILLK